MKRLLLSIFAIGFALSASAIKVYINPGHGSWGANCRPMATINYAAGDTLGFFESNTNLWKAFAMEAKLKAAGFSVKLSRRASGGTINDATYNKALSTICNEAENYGADYYISIHSNAGPDGSDGSFANYPVMLYRGYTGSPKVKNSDKMAKKCVARLYEIFYKTPKKASGGGGPEPTTYYSPSNPNVLGDLSFYNTSSTYGYLGALKHNIPGFLSEGYFHTYSPARHRALNTDWCRQEGVRYYRGVMDYYGKAGETVGYILGYVRSKTEKFSHKHYIPYPGSNDQYKPLNGAKIVLRNSEGEVIKCNCYPYVKRMLKNQDYYTTDHNYNGVFMFENLKPGKYTLYVHKSGYKDVVKEVTVTADKTIYPEIFMEKGTGTEPNIDPIDPDIEWELNGGRVPGTEPPTQEELWAKYQSAAGLTLGTLADLKAAAGSNPHSDANTPCACRAICAKLDAAKVQAVFAKAEWKWLQTYIAGVQTALAETALTEAAWRYAIAAFFLQSEHTAWPASANFATAGKPSAWGDAYLEGSGESIKLPHTVTSTYTLPTPIRDGYEFVGWFDNAAGTGTALTSIPAGWKGTLYAIWKEIPKGDVIWELNGGTVSGTLPLFIEGSAYTPPTPTRAGYIFVGWYNNAEGTGTAITSLPVGYKGTVYAIWREAKVTWVLNGGKVWKEVTSGGTAADVVVPTNDSLWQAFKAYFNKYYNLNRADQPIELATIFWPSDVDADAKILTDAGSEYKWLGDYIAKVTTDAGREINTEVLWRFGLSAFFNCSPAAESAWNGNADFTTAGKPEKWGPKYQEKYAGTAGSTTTKVEVQLPTQITTPYTIPTPEKENCVFMGWYNNANGTGTALTVLPVSYEGSVYAIWQNAEGIDITWVLNGGTVSETLPLKIEGSAYILPTPTREGYVFVGWYDNAEGTGTALTSLPVGYKGTLYAIWREAKVTWVLNGGKVWEEVTVPGSDVAVPTQEELWAKYQSVAGLSLGTLAEIKAAGEGKPHNDQDNQCACRIICAKLDAAKVQAVFAKAEWKWLMTYIMGVQADLTDDLTSAAWRYAIAAFFLQSEHTSWPASANFAEAGKPEKWGPQYQEANGGTSSTTTKVEVTLPSKITGAPYTIPTPEKDNDVFVGWYDNNNGYGTALTVLPVGYDGTVYAIWKSTPTGIENVTSPVLDINAPMYDVLGRQVDETYRGIIIQNGRKYLLR